MTGKNRLPALTKRYSDESTEKEFRFTFYCEHCGAGYQSPPIPFSGASQAGDFASFTRAGRLIWAAEYEDAYERANRRALSIFTPCAQCGKQICEDCQDELADIVLCPDCRAKNNLTDYRRKTR